MSAPRLELVPEVGLELVCFDGDGPRFIDVFQKTWRKLPSQVTNEIIAFWNKGQRLIELSNLFAPDSAETQVGRCGMEVKFRAKVFDHLPSEAASWAIALTLARVYRQACGSEPVNLEDSQAVKSADEHAISKAKSWGFTDSQDKTITFLLGCGRSLPEACNEASNQ